MPAFSLDAQEMIVKLKEAIRKKKAANNEKIARLEAKRNETQGWEKWDKYYTQTKELRDTNKELEEVEEEIEVLAVSNQTYHLVTNTHIGNDPNIDYQGNTRYNPETGEVELQFSAGRKSIPLDVFAHELKHAYQFETGTISLQSTRTKYGLYDKEDEREAFARGKLFGSKETFNRQASVYDHVPDSRDFSPGLMNDGSGQHTWKSNIGQRSVFVITPEKIREFTRILQDTQATPEAKANADRELQSLSNVSGSYFHANGKTYTPSKNR
jgi:hypothetical protein